MIPKNINRAHVLSAMKTIDSDGIPKSRLSHEYFLRHNGKVYPPKYTLSLANKYANGIELASSEFGGGAETNIFLRNLGFEVVPDESSAQVCNAVTASKSVKIVTVTIESSLNRKLSNDSQLNILETVVSAYTKASVILFPAGFFCLNKQGEEEVKEINDNVANILKNHKSNAYAVFGIDCDRGKDQLAIAVNSNGTAAIGRKFYPTYDEDGYIRAAQNYNDSEMGYTRLFESAGKTFYMAVCYDCFGIRHCNCDNPGVDVVLTLAHRFCQKGDGPSGDVDFERKGFAGASQQWQCPVFGTATFFGRKVPAKWPTGVLFTDRNKSVRHFKYEDNNLSHDNENIIIVKNKKAVCYEYTLK